MHGLPSNISGGADVTRKIRRKDKKENMSLKRTGQMADDDSNDLFRNISFKCLKNCEGKQSHCKKKKKVYAKYINVISFN